MVSKVGLPTLLDRADNDTGLRWIWISVDISMDITLAQPYSVKPMQNSSKLQTTCTFIMIICFNYLLLCICITISERNACVMVVLI